MVPPFPPYVILTVAARLHSLSLDDNPWQGDRGEKPVPKCDSKRHRLNQNAFARSRRQCTRSGDIDVNLQQSFKLEMKARNREEARFRSRINENVKIAVRVIVSGQHGANNTRV
jgi:hypothetical protein